MLVKTLTTMSFERLFRGTSGIWTIIPAEHPNRIVAQLLAANPEHRPKTWGDVIAGLEGPRHQRAPSAILQAMVDLTPFGKDEFHRGAMNASRAAGSENDQTTSGSIG